MSRPEEPATPLFSVVIPVHNRELQVVDAVESVLRQSLADFELIIVDDGSTDATAAAVRAIDDGRLRLHQQPQSGASVARNAGAKLASGRLLTFLDSDDTVEVDWLMVFAKMLADPDAAVVSCAVRHVTQAGEEIEVVNPNPLDGFVHRSDVLFSHGGSYALRTDLFREVGGFDEGLAAGQHTELGYRLLSRLAEAPGSVVSTTETLLNYRVGSLDGLRGNSRAVISGTLRVLDLHGHHLSRSVQAKSLAVVAHRSMLLGNRPQARRYALHAVRRDPRKPKHWARAGAYWLLPWRIRGSKPTAVTRFYISLQRHYSNCADIELLRRQVDRLLERGHLVVRIHGVPETILAAVLPQGSDRIEKVQGSLLFRALVGSFGARVSQDRRDRHIVWLEPGFVTVGGSSVHALLRGAAFRLIRLLGGHVVQVGISVSIYPQRLQLGNRYYYRSFSKLGVQDPVSRERLESVVKGPAIVTPDLARDADSQPEMRLNENGWPEGRVGVLGLSFQDVKGFHRHLDRNPRGLVDLLADSVVAGVEISGFEPRSYSQVPGDRPFNELVVEATGLGVVRSVTLDPESGDLHQVRDYLRSTSMVVTNRLQMFLCSLFAGCLPVAYIDAVEQSNIRSYLCGVGLEGLIVDLRLPAAHRRSRLANIVAHRDHWLAACAAYVDSAEEQLSETLTRLDVDLGRT